MTSALSLALLVASATAQLTTSIWAPESPFGTDKFGYYGSVIGASEGHTTLLLTYDNGTDKEALGFGTTAGIYTVGPTLFEFAEILYNGGTDTKSDARTEDQEYRIRCERQSTGNTGPTCIQSYGRMLATRMQCRTQPARSRATSTQLWSRTHSYSGRGSYSAGVETLVQTMVWRPVTTPNPDWCDDETYLRTFNGYSREVPASAIGQEVATYQVIITAGLEKLNATAGASATPSTVQPTGTQTNSTGVSTSGSAAAAPMKTAGPAFVGFGAAMAAFFL